MCVCFFIEKYSNLLPEVKVLAFLKRKSLVELKVSDKDLL